jgi:type VI secretion system protein ImpB
MARDSGQKFIRRNRPPRVHITYENPANAEEKVEIPFVMGVMADLSGNHPGVEKADIAQREFRDVDLEKFDSFLQSIKPGVSFRVQDQLSENPEQKMGVQLQFEKMADFEPAAVARQVPAVAKLLKAREQLANLVRYMDGKVAAEDALRKLLSDPQLMATFQNRAPTTPTSGESES